MNNGKFVTRVRQGKRQKLVDFDEDVKSELDLITNILKGKVVSQERRFEHGLLIETIVYRNAPSQIKVEVFESELGDKSIVLRSVDNEIGPIFFDSEEEVDVLTKALEEAKLLLKKDGLPQCHSS